MHSKRKWKVIGKSATLNRNRINVLDKCAITLLFALYAITRLFVARITNNWVDTYTRTITWFCNYNNVPDGSWDSSSLCRRFRGAAAEWIYLVISRVSPRRLLKRTEPRDPPRGFPFVIYRQRPTHSLTWQLNTRRKNSRTMIICISGFIIGGRYSLMLFISLFYLIMVWFVFKFWVLFEWNEIERLEVHYFIVGESEWGCFRCLCFRR